MLVSFPFTDLTSAKRRPALVVSPDSFNARGQDLVLAAVTSQVTTGADTVPLRPEDFEDGRLPKPSMVKLSKMFTLNSSLVSRRVCRVTAARREEVLRELRRFFS